MHSYFTHSRSSSHFSSLVSLKGPTIRWLPTPTLFPWSPSRRIVSRASCERRPTSRNVTSDIRETKCTIRLREKRTSHHRASERVRPRHKLTLDEITSPCCTVRIRVKSSRNRDIRQVGTTRVPMHRWAQKSFANGIFMQPRRRGLLLARCNDPRTILTLPRKGGERV